MHERHAQRTSVEIPVTVTTVLDSVEATIVDLSEHGAQISGVGLPQGMRLQIEYLGQTLFAQCRWSEIDRMGIKLLFTLADGPLYDRLTMARAKVDPAHVSIHHHAAAHHWHGHGHGHHEHARDQRHGQGHGARYFGRASSARKHH